LHVNLLVKITYQPKFKFDSVRSVFRLSGLYSDIDTNEVHKIPKSCFRKEKYHRDTE